MKSKKSTAERDEEVLFVLKRAEEPLGPTEIARRINQPWCVNGYPLSSAITPVLRRIGATPTGKGKYTYPEERAAAEAAEETYPPYYMIGRGAA
jgi:hypothetical protein